MALYSVDVRFYGTLYVRADSPEQARALAADRSKDLAFEVPDFAIGPCGEFETTRDGEGLAPVMTCHGPDADTQPEFCEESVD